MSWRTIIISSRCKLDLKMGYMIIRGEDTKRVFLDEIAVVLIENPAVAMTGCLLSALIEKKVKVVFCDNRRSPQAELVPYYGSHDCARKLKHQLSWNETVKGTVWSVIVAEKIHQQSLHLLERGYTREAALLESYIGQIEFQDLSNREGHAAKVYFNALFGMDFTRSDSSPINAALNYGYSILLSAFNREIVCNGYLTQLGLHHDNIYNQFNLSSDLMEPFRIVIDRIVCGLEFLNFDRQAKRTILDKLNELVVVIDQNRQTVLNAIAIYTRSVFEALNERDPALIKTYLI